MRGEFVIAILVAAAAATVGEAEPSRDVGPTYAQDIAPIVSAHCVGCHQPDQIAPISFRSYDEIRPWAKAIARTVSSREMPPFFAGGPTGQFLNDNRLSQSQIDLVVDWVRQGAREGDPSLALEHSMEPVMARGIVDPDLEIHFPPYDVAVDGEEEFVNLVGDYRVRQDMWIQSAELRLSDHRHLHHAGIVLLPYHKTRNHPRTTSTRGASDEDVVAIVSEFGRLGTNMFFVWAPGYATETRPEGTAVLVPRGSVFGIQAHFASNGEPGSTQLTLALKFANGTVVREERKWGVLMPELRIDPMVASHVERHILPQDPRFAPREDVEILGYWIHMHARGKSASITLHEPGGSSVSALTIPHWNPDWQPAYVLEEPLVFRVGSTLEFEAEWDNSPNNPRNPDPTKTVLWGPRSTDEMYGATVYVAHDLPEPIFVREGVQVPQQTEEGIE